MALSESDSQYNEELRKMTSAWLRMGFFNFCPWVEFIYTGKPYKLLGALHVKFVDTPPDIELVLRRHFQTQHNMTQCDIIYNDQSKFDRWKEFYEMDFVALDCVIDYSIEPPCMYLMDTDGRIGRHVCGLQRGDVYPAVPHIWTSLCDKPIIPWWRMIF